MRTTTGLVVAGGRSSRFGDRNKAFVPVDGTPMVSHVADRICDVVDELVVNCRREHSSEVETALTDCTHEPRFAHDTVPDQGPVYGLQTGFRVAAGTYAVVVACDMPLADPTLLAYLHNRARSTRAEAVVPRIDGTRQPLCAVYRVDPARERCDQLIGHSQSHPALRDLLSRLDVDTVTEETACEYADKESFTNVNTPADLDALDTVGDDAPAP